MKKQFYWIFILVLSFLIPSHHGLWGSQPSHERNSQEALAKKTLQQKANKNTPGNIKSEAQTFPARYDLRELGRVTAIRNQGNCGSCWTFGALASLESCLLPEERWDFSEQHMNLNHGFDFSPCDGGGPMVSLAYLIRWDGPVSEADCSYPYSKRGEKKAYQVQKHVQQVIALPRRNDHLDNDLVKEFVVNDGAVRCGMSFGFQYLNNSTNGYYNPNFEGTGHTVAIVGWDDNFSKEKFLVEPKGDGAFIIKTSDGPGIGENGYFYLSYYDPNIAKFYVYNNAEPVTNYDTIYQYDMLAMTQAFGYDSQIGWGANLFTAVDNKPLRAVGVFINGKESEYRIHVYKNVTAGSPRSGTQASVQSGTIRYPGYYTIVLDTEVPLTTGEQFSIVVRFKNGYFDRPIPLEKPISGYSMKARANRGESFVSPDGEDWSDATTVFANTNVCIKAYSGGSSTVIEKKPHIDINRNVLNFAAVPERGSTDPQTFSISNTGPGTLNWSIEEDAEWLSCNPSSGTGSGKITVSVNSSGLAVGAYSAVVNIRDNNADNSPKQVTVHLTVKNVADTSVPFGMFATPTDGADVRSSIPVTGWALDDVGVQSIKIYNGSNYIGDAVFVEGARPDVETDYPDYPLNYKAGWGYMLLTNFLPGGGNGAYNLKAVAVDIEGNAVTLGTHTIHCDNNGAVKPFGALDTPPQGGIASGSDFINWGWVLTPQPNRIPIDGTSISVYIDGIYVGRPEYNIYRQDIAALFPGYVNSNGAVGKFHLDTTIFENGIHNIHWVASDNSGNTDGIGSRYFSIENSTVSSHTDQIKNEINNFRSLEQLIGITGDTSNPVEIQVGLKDGLELRKVYGNEDAITHLKINELERIKINLICRSNSLCSPISKTMFFDSSEFGGYLCVGNRLTSLPVGSSLDKERGIFIWQPGPGFNGQYKFVFIQRKISGELLKRIILLEILPQD